MLREFAELRQIAVEIASAQSHGVHVLETCAFKFKFLNFISQKLGHIFCRNVHKQQFSIIKIVHVSVELSCI